MQASGPKAQFFHSLQKRVMPFDQLERRFGTSREFSSFWGNGFWATSGQIFSALGMVLGIRIITEYVSPSVFGTVSLCMGIVALGSGVFNGPVCQALLRMYPDMQRQSRLPLLMTEIRRLLIESNGLLLVGGIAAGVIYWILYGVDFLVLLLLGGLFVLEALRGFVVSNLSANNEIKMYAFVASGDVWARQAFAVLLIIILGPSVTSIMGGYLVGGALLLSLSYTRGLRGLCDGSHGCNDLEQGKYLRQEIVEFSRPLMPIALAGWVSGLADRYIIGGMLGLEAAGIYAAIYAFVSKPFLMISNAVELALRQSYYHAVSMGDKRGQTKVMSTWVLSTLVVSSAFLVLMTCWADELTGLFFGEKFKNGASLMPWIAAGYCLFVLSVPLQRRAYAHKKTSSVFKIQAGGALASVVAGAAGTYFYGLLGAACAVPVYFGCQLALAVYLTRTLSGSSLCLERKAEDD